MSDTKSIFTSWTAWFGLAVTIVSALQAFDWAQIFPHNPQLVGTIGSVLGVVIIALRFITTKPVSITGK